MHYRFQLSIYDPSLLSINDLSSLSLLVFKKGQSLTNLQAQSLVNYIGNFNRHKFNS